MRPPVRHLSAHRLSARTRPLASRLLPALALAAALSPGLAPAGPAEDALAAWITGDWMDPRVHRCDQVWVRIRVEGEVLRHYTVTFGNAVPGMAGDILGVEPDGSALLYNPVLGFEQRVRFVTRDAHVLERGNGAGGVTFVRCPGSGNAPGS